jgi:hypothetical protein
MGNRAIQCLIVIVLVAIAAILTMAPVSETKCIGYTLFRADANETATTTITLASAAGGAWENRPAATKSIVELRPITNDTPANGLQFIFSGGSEAGADPDNKTFAWTLYAWKNVNSPCEFVAAGTGTIGNQGVYRWPNGTLCSATRKWADTVVITSQRFPTVLYSTASTGSDEIAKLVIPDAFGYAYWYAAISSADGETGTEVNAVSSWWSYL